MKWEIYNSQDEDDEDEVALRTRHREPSELEKCLTEARCGEYNPEATKFFAYASAWAYSDTATFANVMCRHGVGGPCISLEVKNDALFVDTKAYLFQSRDRKLLVLAVRGTEPTNLINWLMNASVKTDPFFNSGRVHGGFLRTGIVTWSVFKKLLLAASQGKSLTRLCTIWNDPNISCSRRLKDEEDFFNEDCNEDRKMTTFYTIGHSLGGAMAALAAAAVHMDPDVRHLAVKLWGAYTFGQPSLCDPTLADTLEEKLGEKVFRHNYKRDIVPYLPPRTTGKFLHFGREYTSSEDGVWVQSPGDMQRQTLTALSMVIGAAAWVKEQVPFLKGVELPYSWAHHSPYFYIQTSAAPHPDAELL